MSGTGFLRKGGRVQAENRLWSLFAKTVQHPHLPSLSDEGVDSNPRTSFVLSYG